MFGEAVPLEQSFTQTVWASRKYQHRGGADRVFPRGYPRAKRSSLSGERGHYELFARSSLGVANQCYVREKLGRNLP